MAEQARPSDERPRQGLQNSAYPSQKRLPQTNPPSETWHLKGDKPEQRQSDDHRREWQTDSKKSNEEEKVESDWAHQTVSEDIQYPWDRCLPFEQ